MNSAPRIIPHTPGPWHTAHEDDAFRGHIMIHSDHHGALAQVVWKMDDEERSPQCEANALLIAEAPTMLDLLRREPNEGHTKLWQDKRRALLKRIEVVE